MQPTVDEVIAELTWARGYYPRDAVAAAVRCGPAIAQPLIEAIEFATREPVEDGYVLHLVALFVLAEMRERRAYPAIVAMCRQTEQEIDALIGDIVTEDLPFILASVAQEDDSRLRNLVVDEGVCEVVRVAALDAMACSAVERKLDRSGFRSFLHGLLRGGVVPRSPCWVWDEAACIATDLGFVEMLPDILQAFDEGLLQVRVIDRSEVVEELSQERTAFERRGRWRYRFIQDAAAELARWEGCWTDQVERDTPPEGMFVRRSPKVGRNDPCPCGSGKKFKKCCLVGGSPAQTEEG